MNSDENVPAIIPRPIVKANVLITHVPKMNIATTTNNVEIDVHKDLLMVCRKLVSITLPTSDHHDSSAFSSLEKFSLILSKIIIVSLIL